MVAEADETDLFEARRILASLKEIQLEYRVWSYQAAMVAGMTLRDCLVRDNSEQEWILDVKKRGLYWWCGVEEADR